jgi:hypothetical protein
MLGLGDISAVQRLRYNGHWFLEHLYGETLLGKGAPRALFESQKRALRERIRRTNPTMQEFLRNGDDFAYNFGKTRPVETDND